MKPSNPLRETLKSMTRVYHARSIPVKFGSPSRAVPKGETISGEVVTEPTVVIDPAVNDRFQKQLSGPEELRCLNNTLSHEIEHIRESNLISKRKFSQTYEQYSHFAGGVINVLEDQYVDYMRIQRFPGLRSTQAFVINRLLEDNQQWPQINTIENRPKAMFEGLRQVAFAGYAKGITEADVWLREFLSRVRPHIKNIRQQKSQSERKEIAHTVMEIATEYLQNTDINMPDVCSVCNERTPDIIVPTLGPVCENCAPTGHGQHDGVEENKQTSVETPTGDSDNQSEDATTDPEAEITDTPVDESVSQSENPEQPDSKVDQSTTTHHQKESTQKEAADSTEITGQIRTEEVKTLDALAQNKDSAPWWDVPDNVDYQTPTKQDVARYNRIQQAIQENRGLESDLRNQREKANNSDRGLSRDCMQHSANLQSEKDWRRLQDEHRQMFRKIASRDMSVPSKSGSNLNIDGVVQRAAGDVSQNKLYTKKQTIASGDRAVAVSADMSGSMDGRQVRLAVAAIAEATAIVGDEFLATCWRKLHSDSGGYLCQRDSTGFGLVCGVNEPFQWEQLDAFDCSGGTPTADGIDLTSQLMEGLHTREKLLIVITDGKPNVSYGKHSKGLTATPVGDAAQVVQQVQSKNIKIIGLYVGTSAEETAMTNIFGDKFVTASIDELAKELIEIYRRQLRI